MDLDEMRGTKPKWKWAGWDVCYKFKSNQVETAELMDGWMDGNMGWEGMVYIHTDRMGRA